MSAKEPAGNKPIGQSEKAEKAVSALSEMCAERIQIVATEEIDGWVKLSNNIYNEANYRVRQQFFKTGNELIYFELCRELRASVNYTGLLSKTTLQIIKLVVSEWQLFFINQVSYQYKPEKFTSRPKIPKYQTQDNVFVLVFNN